MCDERTILAATNLRRWEKRIVIRETKIVFQHCDIVADELKRFGTYRKEYGREGLAPLGVDLARVLEKGLCPHVEMLQPKGGERAVTRARQYRKGD